MARATGLRSLHLKEIFKRQIDLLENKAIKNQYLRENIDRSKILIYAA